jgi:hypothetical protein
MNGTMATRIGSNIALGLQGRGDDGVLERMVIALHRALVRLTRGKYMAVLMGNTIIDQSCLIIVHPKWNMTPQSTIDDDDDDPQLGETTIALIKSLASNRIAMVPLLQMPDMSVVAVHFGLMAVCCQRYWWHPMMFAYTLTMAWSDTSRRNEEESQQRRGPVPTIPNALNVIGISEHTLTSSERCLLSCE